MGVVQLGEFFDAFGRIKKFFCVASVIFFLLGYGLSSVYWGYNGYIEQRALSTNEDVPIFVDISGAVVKPGVYKVSSAARVSELVVRAGGFNQHAAISWLATELNLSARLADSQKIYVPFEWDLEDSPPASVQTLAGENTTVETNVPSGEPVVDTLAINSATVDELDALPGIGLVYAQKLIQNRPYASAQDVIDKSGIAKSTLEKILPLVTF